MGVTGLDFKQGTSLQNIGLKFSDNILIFKA